LRSEVLQDVEELFVKCGAMMPGVRIGEPDRVAEEWVRRMCGVRLDGDGDARGEETVVKTEGNAGMEEATTEPQANEQKKKKRLKRKLKEGDVLEEQELFSAQPQPIASAVVNGQFSKAERMWKEVHFRHTTFAHEEWVRWKNWTWSRAYYVGGAKDVVEPQSPRSMKRKADDDMVAVKPKRRRY
jgi:hypothetical protein